MSVYASTTFANSTLDGLAADTPYLALYTSDPGVGNTGTEVSGGSYVRQAITFGAASGGSITSTADITFFGIPAGTITHFGIFDADTAGNFNAGGALGTPVEVGTGDALVISAGSITLSM